MNWPVALCATLIMALSPLYWLQSGLALTDMFGMVFVLAFLLRRGHHRHQRLEAISQGALPAASSPDWR